MTKGLLFFSACVLFMIAGCQKTELAQLPAGDASTDRVAETLIAKGTVSPDPWFGHYDEGEWGDPDGFSLNDPLYIHDGFASLPDKGYMSTINYFIPDQYSISGDSLILETSFQNPGGSSQGDYDVTLELVGSLHGLKVHFVSDAAYLSSTSYSLGTITKTGLPSLVNYFGEFQTIKMSTKKGQTGVYINNKLLYHFAYKADNKIGDIKEIRLTVNGIPSVDYVKLTNSVTNKKKMTEDFNIEGQCHTIFY